MAAAIVGNILAGVASSGGSSSSTDGGIGGRILGAPGAPVVSTIKLISGIKDRRERERQIKIAERAQKLEKDKWGIQRILEQQKNAQAMQQTTWKRGFMQAMAKRGQNQGSIGRA